MCNRQSLSSLNNLSGTRYPSCSSLDSSAVPFPTLPNLGESSLTLGATEAGQSHKDLGIKTCLGMVTSLCNQN